MHDLVKSTIPGKRLCTYPRRHEQTTSGIKNKKRTNQTIPTRGPRSREVIENPSLYDGSKFVGWNGRR